MIDNYVRDRLPSLVRPIIAIYRLLGLSPNTVSFIGFLVALPAAYCVSRGEFGVAVGLWWLSRLFDGTDGIYARESGRATAFGAYLDIVLDMAAYGAMVIGLAGAFPHLDDQWMAVLLLYILCITSALALGAQEAEQGRDRRDNRGLRLGAGLAEAGETSIYYTACLLWPALVPTFTWVWIVILVTTVVARTALARYILR